VFLARLEEKVFEKYPTTFTSKWQALKINDWIYGVG